MSIAIWVSLISLLISATALFRTRTSLSLFVGEDDSITVTNNSAHAVTLVELGVIEHNGEMHNYWQGGDPSPTLPYRLDARDTITFQPDLDMVVYGSFQSLKYKRSGRYVRMASGQIMGNKGRTCCTIGYPRRLWWKLTTRFTKDKP